MSFRIVAAAIFLLAGSPAVASDGPCAEGRVVLAAGGQEHDFSMAVADTTRQRAFGLKGVEALPEGTGMLFVYDAPRNVSMFVNSTPLLIDMMTFDGEGALLAFSEEPEERGTTRLAGGEGMIYAVMIPGGTIGRLGLGGDTRLAGWTCTTPE